MIYVFTSVVNGWDNLRTPAAPVDTNVRYICFTNIPNLPRVYPWEYRPIYQLGVPCRTARTAKILAHLMLPEDAEYSIYHDGNFQLRIDPNRITAELLEGYDWAAYEHPCRACVYREAEVLLKENIGTSELIRAEIERYREKQYPESAGLWANGFIARRHTTEVAELNESWWRLYAAGGERDQLSFPVARHGSGVSVNTIKGNIWSSPYILFNWHAAWKDRDANPDYWPERDRTRARLAKLAEVTGTPGGIHYPEY